MCLRNGAYDYFGMYDFDDNAEAADFADHIEAVGADVTMMLALPDQEPKFMDIRNYSVRSYLCQWPGPIGNILS